MDAGMYEFRLGAAESDIIISTAYDGHCVTEADLQRERALGAGLNPKRVHIIGPIVDSYDEAQSTLDLAKMLGAYEIVVLAERDHANRVRKVFRHLWKDGQVRVVPFKTPAFEFTLEPSLIKKLRSGFRLTWFLWNFAFGLPSTAFMIRLSNKLESRRAERERRRVRQETA